MQQSSTLLNSALKVKINHPAVKMCLSYFCAIPSFVLTLFLASYKCERKHFKQGLFNDEQDTRRNDASLNLLGTDFLRCGYYDL